MNNIKMLRVGFLLLIGMVTVLHQKAEASAPNGVNFQVFYNELSPYGDWVTDPTHGYLWIPNVGRDFHPYSTNGYWTMTNFGNTWVSNYDWGWAPFHYGRWFWDDFYGWAWVPDYEWGPAWVSWRSGGGYYGWAPLSPGFGIHVSMNIPGAHWVFIPQRRFRHRNFHRYYVPSYHVVNVINRTTVINNTYVYNNRTYVAGPDRRDIERATRRSVPVYQVDDSSKPGRASLRNNTLAVYRPDVRREISPRNQPRPSRSFTAEEYKRSATSRSAAPSTVNAVRGTAPGVSSGDARSGNAVRSGSEALSPRANRNVQSSTSTQRSFENSRNEVGRTQRNTIRPNTQVPNRTQHVNPRNEGNQRSTLNRTQQRTQHVNPAATRSRSSVGAQQNPRQQRVAPATRNSSPSRSAVRSTASPSRNSGQQVRSSSSQRTRSAATPARSSSGSRSSGGRGNN